MNKLINKIKTLQNKSKQNNKDEYSICVEIDAKESKLDANDTIKLIDKLFKNKHYSGVAKTFVYGGYIQHYISLKQVVKHFANDPSVIVVTFNGDKYRRGKKVED